MSVKIPLRNWIKGVLDAICESNTISNGSEAITSSTYLEFSLKIAVSLTQQIIEADDTLDVVLLPLFGADLASHVYVAVRTKVADNITSPAIGINIPNGAADDDENSFLTPLPFACGINQDEFDLLECSISDTTENALFSVQDGQSMPSSGWIESVFDTELINDTDHDLPFRCAQDEIGEIVGRTEDEKNDEDRFSSKQNTSLVVEIRDTNTAQCLDYFTIESAEICLRDTADFDDLLNGSDGDCKAAQIMIRIHHLGLLFYELFSGGETPHSELEADYSSKIDSSETDGSLRGLNLADDSVDHSNPPKMQRSRVDNRRSLFYEVSIEYLRLMGLPSSLCDLIYNMLNSINRDMSGNDTYSEMSDVMNDLLLMLEKPSKFLQDLDSTTTLMTGLNTENSLFTRGDELTSLQDAYRRFTSGSSEFAVILGMAGTGKSCLANRFGTIIKTNGGLFLAGKFDQMKQHKPFSALASAFNDYFVRFNADEDPARRKSVASSLHLSLGQDLRYLTKIIPALGLILESDYQKDDALSDQDCVNGQKRIVYMFCRFIKFLSTSFNAPVTLFLDDIQWSDAATVSVLSQLLKSSQQRQFFLLGCCRDDERENYFLKEMQDCVSYFGYRSNVVELGCLNENTVKKIISDLLCLSPRLVAGLSNIVHHKTKGNPLLFLQLLQSLNRDGILRFNLGRRRWEWDEGKIQSRELPEDLAIFFASNINKLPPDVKKALCVLSCFGASTKCSLIEVLESKLGFDIADKLDVVVREGLIYKSNGRYHFGHDRIQEAAYGIMKEEDRCLHHLEYGLSLANVSIETGDDALLLTSVNQINLAGPAAVSDATEASKISHFNLIAGMKAIDMSDFTSAHSYFDNGISFLKKNHWKNNYGLSLKLFESAAQCSLVLGDVVSLAILSDQVDKSARSLGDKIKTHLIVMTSLQYSSRIDESVGKGLSILSQLGHPIPAFISDEDIFRQIKEILPDMSNHMNYNIMSDKSVLMAMKFLAAMHISAYQAEPSLQPLITLKMIRLTLTYGVSPDSPVAFACFAGLLGAIGQMVFAHQYTKLAKTLHYKVGSKESEGHLLFSTSELLSFYEPLLSVNEFRKRGEESAMGAGDINYACLNRMSCCGSLFWAGVNLIKSQKTLLLACRFMAEQEHLSVLHHLIPYKSTISELIGHANETQLDDQLKTFLDHKRNPNQVRVFHFHRMYLAFMFNKSDCLTEAAQDYFANQSKHWFLMSFAVSHAFFGGLVSFRMYRETRERLWAVRGGQFKSLMFSWAKNGSSWNFEHKSLLLEAEEQHSNGDVVNAQAAYDKAISSAKAHKNLCDEALAWELAGNFILGNGDELKSIDYLVNAHEKYEQWGAYAKATALYDVIRNRFGSCSVLR